MSGWQQILVYLASGVAGVLVGLLLYFVIRRVQKRSWAFSPAASNTSEKKDLSEEQIELGVEMRKTQPEPVKVMPAPAPQVEIAPAKKSEILVEVEKNLSVSTCPWTGRMSSFQTKAWDTYGGRIDSVPSDLYSDLAEAYADMRLANTLVWLSSDVGRKNKDLDESYLTLCNKITERLEKVRSSLIRSGSQRTN
jgi:hypothetical protein